jgi:AraC-like DNA-binding protein
MRTDIERFGLEELIAADPERRAPGAPASFAVQVPELRDVGVHWHDYYELGHVLDGEATHVVNGVPHAVAPGSTFLLSPADFHSFEPAGDRPVRMLNAVVHPELVERTLEAVLPDDDLDLPWTVAASPDLADAVRRVCDEVEERARGWEVIVESSIRSLLVTLARASAGSVPAPEGTAGAGPSAHVRRALRYVERHFREPLTLTQVASVAHLSPHWFSEQFRRATGDSFQSYLKRRRLQFARALLESTDLGVTEVGRAAGFADPSYFARAYRSHYGGPPSGGRRRAR